MNFLVRLVYDVVGSDREFLMGHSFGGVVCLRQVQMHGGQALLAFYLEQHQWLSGGQHGGLLSCGPLEQP